ncbi:MAG: hypothetical protein HETSPECPRED_000551 [Heterodermia speciosa]|uniref:BTB domain-containing protein n=1 Tax=Heterodermia speciosa TaxID=116794 RepID=A0A8H3G7Y0_9LECA|nr:MAG: hypothetical protein HETSPECPRED_000551 [Heterodermia speciosa]
MPPQRSNKQNKSSNNAPTPYTRSKATQANSQSDNKLSSSHQFRSFSSVPMVTLLVGDKETPFNIHMDLLCKASPFFKSAFMGAGNFMETCSKSMKLPEDDPATMDRLIHWVYFGCYPVDSKSTTKSSDQQKGSLDASLMPFATLYVAADKYGIIELKNHVIHQLFDIAIQGKFSMATLNVKLIGYIYENTTPGSTLRSLLVKWHVWLAPYYFKGPWTEKEVCDHADFAADVLVQFAARVQGRSNPFESRRYRFHEKLEGEVTESSGREEE